MGRWGLGRVIRGREGLPTTWVHPDFFPGALAFQLPDPGVPTKRKVQGKGCQGREAPPTGRSEIKGHHWVSKA